jgi:hypothetical protein
MVEIETKEKKGKEQNNYNNPTVTIAIKKQRQKYTIHPFSFQFPLWGSSFYCLFGFLLLICKALEWWNP